MSKQNEAKLAQGYEAHPLSVSCQNCQHYRSRTVEIEGAWGRKYNAEKDRRCGLGGFAVLKTARCVKFEPKP